MASPSILTALRTPGGKKRHGMIMSSLHPDTVDSTDTREKDDIMTSEATISIWTRNFTLLCCANLALFMSSHALSPTLPVYMVQIGGSQRSVGYIMAAYTIGAMIMRPIAGRLVDRRGRKQIMVLGLFSALLITLLYRFAADVPQMLVIRCLHGLTYGMIGTAIGTMVADSLPVARFTEGMGYFGLTSSISMAITPAVGFWLIGTSGFEALFLAVVMMTGLALFCSFTVKRTGNPLGPQTVPGGDVWTGLLEKTALPASGVMFFVSVVWGSVISFIALHAAEQGIANIGLFFSANALAMFIARPLSGRWADSGNMGMVLLVANLAVFVGMVTVGFSQTVMGFSLAGAVLGLGFGFYIPTLQTLAVRDVPADRRGAATGTFFIAIDLGIGLGTVALGYVAEALGYQVMFFTTLIPLALAGTICCRFRGSRRNA